MKSPGPSKAERIAEVVICSICITVAVGLAGWYPSLLSIAFASVVTILLLISLVKSHWRSEEEMMRQIDKAMGKPSDDPREMARWVP